MTAPPPTRVFISYAHDSVEHQEAVRDLWVLLRSLGVDAKLDLPAADRRQDWPIWMLRQVRQADYVLVIASSAYRRRAEGDANADEGRGVQFEAALLREELYRDRETGIGRFLPVLLPGRSTEDIPAFLGPTTATSYRITELTLAGVERLLRVLTNQPLEHETPLGTVPVLPPRSPGLAGPAGVAALATPSPLTHELVLEVALEGGQLHCRTVLAGTMLAEHTAAVPYGMDDVWAVLAGPPTVAEERLAAVGQRLREALLDELTMRRVLELLDHSPLGTVVEVVIQADGAALALPYELLRLPDGRLLATIPGVRLRRRVAGVDRQGTGPLPGPLKLLVAVAAPEETRTPNPPLDVEAEMQAILDAVGGVGGRGDAQVTILEVASLQQISEALRADQYHVLHLSAHGSAAGVELEDEDGNPVWVDAAKFVDQLRAAERPLPLLVLSSCAGGAGGSDALAAVLVRHGVDRVVAMQAAVTDRYATRLAREFYETLAAGSEVPAAAALAEARRQTEQDRVAAQQAGGKPLRPEYGVATLLAGGDPPLRDPGAKEVPLARPTRVPSGTGVRELRIGDLIGRRRQLRTALAALRGGQAALDRFGDIAGVLVCGVGGIGKTAVAGRILTRLAEDGWLTAVHEGRWDPPALTAAVATALDGDDRLTDARTLLTNTQVDDTTKLAVVHQLLAGERLLVLFDDFEQNLTAGGGGYHDPGFAEVIDGLCQAATVGRLLVTSRYPLPDSQGLLERIDVPPLSASELRRLLLRLPALRELDAADRQVLVGTIGGHPRLIQFVDALLRQGRANLRAVTSRLHDLARDHGISLHDRRPVTQAVEEAVLLGSRDIFLDQLLAIITDEERELMLQAAVSTLPMTTEDLAIACWDANPTVEQKRSVTTAAERLVDLTLLSSAGDGEVVVHAWIADALRPHQQQEALDQRHRRAADMRLARFPAGRGSFGDLVEVCRHRAAAHQFDELIGFAEAASAAIAEQLGELSVAAFLGQVVPLVPPEVHGFLPLADREMQALLNTGSVAAAADRQAAIVAAARQRTEANPANSDAQHDLGVAYERLGDLLVAAGDLGEAERMQRDSLAIAERLAQADPTNAEAQRQLSVAFEKLGDLLVAAGDLGEAERLYRDSLTIRDRLANADPTSAQAQRDLSISYNKLGDLLVAAGDLGEAERFHRDSLAIAERLAQVDPTNAQAQRDLGVSYERLGDLLVAAGNLEEAERLYRDSLAIAERLAQVDPTNAEAQRDLSISYIKIGDLLVAAGDLGEAERFRRDSLAIAERLAQVDPTNAQAQRDLSISYTKIGDLLVAAGDLGEAERFHRDNLAIAERLAQADPTNAQAQRDLSISYQRLGDLLVAAGDLGEAERFHRDSLAIAERLAQVDPTNAQAQRDLSISYTKIGDLLVAAGDLGEAERLYRDSLTIRDRLASADPTSAQAQRDLSISYERLGDLLVAAGDLGEAERMQRDSLAIAERLAQADPTNAQAQRDLGVSYQRLGDLLQATGNLQEVERMQRDSLAIAERLAQADPTNAQAQRDLSVSYNKLGDLLVAAGDLGEAERLYRDSLTIRDRLASADPTSAQAQRDLSISYIKIGDLLVAAGELGEAERFRRDSLAIVERLAQVDPTNAEAQRDLSISYERLGDLLVAAGDLEEAERFHRDSLAIAERLAQVDPTNAQAQRDLSISYIKIGDLLVAAGDLGEAERLYRDSLAIVERLAQADPTNAEAQRDLSIIYERLGDMLRATGNLEEVERLYRDSLAITERTHGLDHPDVQQLKEKLQGLKGDKE